MTAVLLDAEAALRWLATQPSHVDEVKRAIVRIINESRRAAEALKKARYPG